MSRSGGRSALAEIGRQIVTMLEQASREVTQAPYARPEEGPPRQRPRPALPRQPEAGPVEIIPDEEAVRPQPRRREQVQVARQGGFGRSIRAQLRSKSAVRRALVMNEILGPPKSMSDDFYQ